MKGKFKIWATIAWGYRYALKNWRLILQFGWLPMLVVCIAFMAIPALVALDIDLSIMNIPKDAITVLAGSHFAVRWHRAILLNDKRRPLFRYGRPEALYALFLLPGVIADYVSDFIIAFELTPAFTLFSLFLVLIVACILSIAIPMLLPGLAIEDRKMSLERAWGLWAGNRIRFAVFVFFGGLIFWAAWVLITKVSSYVSLQLAYLFNIDFSKISPGEGDFLTFVAVFNLSAPVLVCVLFFLMASSLGALSVSYAGINKPTKRAKTQA